MSLYAEEIKHLNMELFELSRLELIRREKYFCIFQWYRSGVCECTCVCVGEGGWLVGVGIATTFPHSWDSWSYKLFYMAFSMKDLSKVLNLRFFLSWWKELRRTLDGCTTHVWEVMTLQTTFPSPPASQTDTARLTQLFILAWRWFIILPLIGAL